MGRVCQFDCNKDEVVDAYRGIQSKFTDDPGQLKKYKQVM